LEYLIILYFKYLSGLFSPAITMFKRRTFRHWHFARYLIFLMKTAQWSCFRCGWQCRLPYQVETQVERRHHIIVYLLRTQRRLCCWCQWLVMSQREETVFQFGYWIIDNLPIMSKSKLCF